MSTPRARQAGLRYLTAGTKLDLEGRYGLALHVQASWASNGDNDAEVATTASLKAAGSWEW
ncbi:hypothetical protein IFR05_016638 [Cadophora sp. M221]|nr:hypothetical protein IFR05_016638 [Cadophora sp. M221]